MLAFSASMVVVIGTGTDVGKTHVTAALLAELARTACAALGSLAPGPPIRPGEVCAWKPIESGHRSGSSDCDVLAAVGRAFPPLYSFTEPLSSHLAARRAGRAIDLHALRSQAERNARECEILLLETAGGLFSPLASGSTNAELISLLAPARVLLVAPDRLGVLHDVGATLRAARAVGLGIDALVLSEPASPDASTGTNASELSEALGFPVGAVFPRASLDAEATRRAARVTLDALRARSLASVAGWLGI